MAAPLKVLIQRSAFPLLVVSAFVLMLLGKGETLLVERFRTGVIDFTAPLMEVLARPAATVSTAIENARELIMLRTENGRLKEENSRLLAWQATARHLSAENEALRDLMRFAPDGPEHFIAARVIADSGGAFVRAMIVNAGQRHGVAKGQAVTTGDGLVGRVFEAGYHSSRVLLITDINSRIPVLVESSRARAILAGDNGERPKLVFLAASAEVAAGDRIVTSGQGGLFPPGLPVGVVASIEGGVVRVAPLVDFDRLEIVRIVDYAGSGPLPAPAEDAGQKR